MLDRLLEIKSNYDVMGWENERRKLEAEMDRYTKYPHIFKAEEIANRQKTKRLNMLKDVAELSKRKISTFRNKFLDTNSEIFG